LNRKKAVMKAPIDRDGKSKASSGAETKPYPKQNEVDDQGTISEFSAESIQAKAYDLWVRRSCPEGTDLENWFEAERELRCHSTAYAG